MNGFNYFSNLIDEKVLNIHTGYLGRVTMINGSTARIQPLTVSKAVGGNATQQSIVNAVIPQGIKYKEETITYMVSEYSTETKTVLIPDKLAVGDIVYVGVCDRDISHAKNGIIGEATSRHHNINDGVILQVVK